MDKCIKKKKGKFKFLVVNTIFEVILEEANHISQRV